MKWSVFCTATARRPRYDLDTRRYFDIADRPDLDYDAKLAAYLELADAYLQTDLYWQWCDEHLPHLEERVLEWVSGPDFDQLLRDTVAATYPAHEHEAFLAHFRGLLGMWVTDQTERRAVG